MAVGAREGGAQNNTKTGVVYLYQFDDGNFTNATLIGRIGKGYTGGKNVDNSYLQKNDKFGRSLSFNSTGTRLAVGATGDDAANNGSDETGAVYLITFDDTSYSGGEIVGRIGGGYTGSKNVNLFRQGVTKKGVTVKSYDLFGSSVALDGDANVLAVGLRGDDGFKQYSNSYDISKAGGVFIIAFDDTDFSNGKVVSRIGNGYQNLSSNSNCAKTNKCAVIGLSLIHI